MIAGFLFRILIFLKPKLSEIRWSKLRERFWRFYWERKQREVEVTHDGAKFPRIYNSERAVLVEKVAENFPFMSIFEFGCAYGQNFRSLVDLFPDVQMFGVDIDELSVEVASNYFSDFDFKNVNIAKGSEEVLKTFSDGEFDIVIASAVLLYIAGDRIEEVVSNLLRIANKKLFILEQHQENIYFGEQHLGVYIPPTVDEIGYWVRDYHKLLSLFVESDNINIKKIDSPIWTSEQWSELAYLFEVNIAD